MEFQLNELQIDYLKRIKKQRSLFALKAFGGLFIIPLGTLLLGSILGSLFLLTLIMILGGIPMIVLYTKRIIPLSLDINEKVGVKIKLQILRKQFFPITNEHFLFLADQDIPNIKVDYNTYKHYQEGDYFSIDKSKHARIVFEDYERYDIV